MSTYGEPEHVVVKLVRYVMRAFYSDLHIIVMDALIDMETVKDSDLAKQLQLQPKQVTTVLRELYKHHLVSTDVIPDKTDKNDPASKYKKDTRQWYIDFKNFVDSVKLRMYYLQQLVQETETMQIKYLCTNPKCGIEYQLYEMMSLANMVTGETLCKRCGYEIEETTTTNGVKSNDNLSSKFEKQLKRIRDCLLDIEKLVIPENPVGRRRYSEIITKEQAQKRQYDEAKRYNIDKKLGGHASSKGNVTYGALGSTGHGNQLNQSKRSATEADTGVMIQIQRDEEENEMESDEEAPVEVKPKVDNPEIVPWFLDRKKNDISKTNQINSEVDATPEDIDIGRINERKRKEKMRTQQVFNELLNTAVDEVTEETTTTEEQPAETTTVDEEDWASSTPAVVDEVMVMVQGEPRGLSTITQDDVAKMTPDEYSDYYQKAGFADDEFM